MKKHILSILAILAIGSLAACIHMLIPRDHSNANLSPKRVSANGSLQVSYESQVQPIPKRKLHAWVLEVRTTDGRPVEDARIAIDGGMPDHGHGLPTQPVVAKNLGEGRYLVEGMKFNMGGYWVVDLAIQSHAANDNVRFEIIL